MNWESAQAQKNPNDPPSPIYAIKIAGGRYPNTKSNPLCVGFVDFIASWSTHALHAVVTPPQKDGAEKSDDDLDPSVLALYHATISASKCAQATGAITRSAVRPSPDEDGNVEEKNANGGNAAA